MVQTLPIAKTITSIAELRRRFNLTATKNDQFFTEWYQNLPELTDGEKASLDRIYQRYLRHRERSRLAEGMVNLLL